MDRSNPQHRFFVIFFYGLAMMALCWASPKVVLGEVESIDIPHLYSASGVNLLSNVSFTDMTGWENSNHVTYSSGGRLSGSGSIFLDANQSSPFPRIKSARMTNFEYGTPYTISCYAKSAHTPAYFSLGLHLYDAAGNRTFSAFHRGSFSSENSWEEFVAVVEVNDPAVVEVMVVIEGVESASYAEAIQVDDVYFGKGIRFEQPPSPVRQSFNATITTPAQGSVKVDKFGNWKTYESGFWKPFFPFALYAELERDDYQSLSDQGFNLVWSQQYVSQVQKAKDAVSDFNPRGMKAGLRLAKYAVNDSDPNYFWTLSLLQSTINDIQAQGLSDTLLCYDWDNENNWSTPWSHWQSMIDTIRINDLDANGNLMHPVYILQGYSGIERAYSKNLSDVVGTYLGLDNTSSAFETVPYRFDILHYLEKQDIPVSIAQLNYVENESYGFRLRTYNSLINGAKGISWWGDTRDFAETQNWWQDIRVLRQEIDQLLALLATPHWTDFTLASSAPEIKFNTRQLNHEGYVILLNNEDVTISTTFTLDNLDYTSDQIVDALTGQVVASVVANQYSVSIPANSTAIYRINNPNLHDAELVSRWNFDGGLGDTVEDRSAYHVDGTFDDQMDPIASWVPTELGTSMQMNTWDGISMGDQAFDNQSASSYTIMGWVKPDAGTDVIASRELIRRSIDSTDGYLVQLWNNGNIYAYQGIGAMDWYASGVQTTPFPHDGQFHHFAFTVNDSAGTVTKVLYVDGVAKSTVTQTGTTNLPDAAANLVLGNKRFEGQMDDFRIYKTALSESEIAAIADVDLVAHWTFNEGNGRVVRDHTSVFVNEGLLEDHMDVDTSWAAGKQGTALQFDNQFEGVVFGDSPHLAQSSYSIAGWLKPNAMTSGIDSRVILEHSSSDLDGFLMLLWGDGTLKAYQGVGGQNWYASGVLSANFPHDGQFHHFVFTVDQGATGVTKKLYVNGALQQTITKPGTTNVPAPQTTPFVLGDKRYQGAMDEFLIYRRVLSDADVIALYNRY